MSRNPTFLGFENGYLPDFSDPAARTRLSSATAHAMPKIAEFWKISDAEACGLLGGLPADRWTQMKAGQWKGTFSEDEIRRVSALVGLFKGLHTLLSGPLADEWPTRPNDDEIFAGQRPIDFMIAGGFDCMMTVRRYIDAACQGL